MQFQAVVLPRDFDFPPKRPFGQWRVAIQHKGLGKTLWKPLPFSVICKNHFKEDDFVQHVQTLTALGGHLQRDLKPDMVPFIFPHSEKLAELQQHKKTEREQRLKKQQEVCEQVTATNSDIMHVHIPDIVA